MSASAPGGFTIPPKCHINANVAKFEKEKKKNRYGENVYRLKK